MRIFRQVSLVTLFALLVFCSGCVSRSPWFIVAGKTVDQQELEVIQSYPPGELTEELPEVFQIEFQTSAQRSMGTGFFVQHDSITYIVTAAHNMRDSTTMRVFRYPGPISVIPGAYAVDTTNDIAVIAVLTDNPSFTLADPLDLSRIPTVMEEVFEPIGIDMYGYPGSWGFRRVSCSVYRVLKHRGITSLVSTGSCESGMSGGPWIHNGKVIAVHTTSLGLIEGNEVQHRSGGTPVNHIHDLIYKISKK